MKRALRHLTTTNVSKAIGVLALISGLGAQLPAEPIVVVGTGDPTVDVPAVQYAVDQGGAVLLKGAFDFGTHAGNHIIVPGRAFPNQDERGMSTVFIYQKDVVIWGETDKYGNLLTTIRNGMPAFYIGWDGNVSRCQPPGTLNQDYGIEYLPVDSLGRVWYRDTGPEPGFLEFQIRYTRAFQGVSATIANIYFDSPRHFGIKATAGKNVAILHNTFRYVQWGGLVHLNSFAGATHIAAACLGIGLFYPPFIFPAVTGNLIIEGNLIDDVGTEPIITHLDECFGAGGLLTAASLAVIRNDIRNIGRKADGTGSDAYTASILTIDNYGGAPVISENRINNCSGIGIWDLTAMNPSPAPLILDNSIANCVVGIDTGSWGPAKSGVIIRFNQISQDGSFGPGQFCINQYGSQDFFIGQNKLSGQFDCGVVLANCGNDVIVENNVSGLISSGSYPTYYLDELSCGNTIGGQGTVFAAAKCDNYIRGAGQIAGAPPLGLSMSETQQRIREAYRCLKKY